MLVVFVITVADCVTVGANGLRVGVGAAMRNAATTCEVVDSEATDEDGKVYWFGFA